MGGLVVEEGKASISFPDDPTILYDQGQEFNRDLSVAVLRQMIVDGLGTDVRVLEALAASGLRAIRYATEISGISQVIAIASSKIAADYIRQNAKTNEVIDFVKPTYSDAVILMHQNKQMEKQFHAVDLDLNGTTAPFLDAAVQCVMDKGILLVTCTDVEVLRGNKPEACHAKYGAMPLRAGCCHEIAVRILLQCIEAHANRYGRYMEPLLSVSVDNCIQVFVRVHTGAEVAKNSCCKTSMIYQCSGCESFVLQPLAKRTDTPTDGAQYTNAMAPTAPVQCEHCGGNHCIAGPVWSAPLHSTDFVKRLLESVKSSDELEHLNTKQRIIGLLDVILKELDDVPLYYLPDRLANLLHCPAPPLDVIRSALLNASFRVSASHMNPQAIKTDASIFDIIRCFEFSRLDEPPKVYYDIVVSYRRHTGSHLANRLKEKFSEAGYTVFMDTQDLGPGKFDKSLIATIRSSRIYVLVLTVGALDRCMEPADMLNIEIETALKWKTNQIFVVYDGHFNWGNASQRLPPSTRPIIGYNGFVVTNNKDDNTLDVNLRRMNIFFAEKIAVDLKCDNPVQIRNACHALASIPDGCIDRIQSLLDEGVHRRLVELLVHHQHNVVLAALRVIAKLCTGNDEQTQEIVNSAALPILAQLLSIPNESIRKEACWAVLNLAGNETQIQSIIDANIVPSLVEVLNEASSLTRNFGASALVNLLEGGTAEQIRSLVQCGIIPPLCELLTGVDAHIIQEVISGFYIILQVGDSDAKANNGTNPYATIFEECGGSDKLIALNEHEDGDIRLRASGLYALYFIMDDEDDADHDAPE